MEHHLIIGEQTLLSKGLQHVLEHLHGGQVKQVQFRELDSVLRNQKNKFKYVWMEVYEDFKSALKVCQNICKKIPNSNMLIFSNEKDPGHIRSMVKTGVKAFLVPSCPAQKIAEILSACSKNKTYIDPSIGQFYTDRILMGEEFSPNSKKLTKREKEILGLIVEEYTTQEIANKLFISFCTVETHRLHLIQKMGVRNTAGLVREALSQNILKKSMNSMSF